MNETPEDLARLQELIDRSYANAGEHLLSIHTPEHRLSAEQVCERLTGMTLLSLATVTSDGRPIIGAVDGIFHRGEFWFGSSPTSLRARHIAANPNVSVIHLPGEHLGITAHGRARPLVPASEVGPDFEAACVDIYGEEWREWGSGAGYWSLDADRFFTFRLEDAASTGQS